MSKLHSHDSLRPKGSSGELRDWLREGPFTLALSSSFFGFFAHCGIVTALYEQGLRPARFSGASAGSLVAAGLASGREPEDLQRLFFGLRTSDFWDPAPGFGVLKGDKFRSMLRSHMAKYFWETRYPIDVAVYDIFARKTCFISEGSLTDAVSASCAVPLMFHPVKINNRFYLDGGISRKSGMQHEKTDERILCIFIESRIKGGGYERRGWPPESPNHRVIGFRDLPDVDYRRLETGRAAFTEAYERARRIFAPHLETEAVSL